MYKPRGIEGARSYETGVTIIPGRDCRQAVRTMGRVLRSEYDEDVAVVPVLEGGRVMGNEVARALGIGPNFIQISNYLGDGQRAESPRLVKEPDYCRIVANGQARRILLVEAVVETRKTIDKAREVIADEVWQRFGVEVPEWGVETLVSKYEGDWGDWRIRASYQVNPGLWVWGMGCDSNQRGRELKRVDAMVSPFAKEIPLWPYVRQLYRPNLREKLLYLVGL